MLRRRARPTVSARQAEGGRSSWPGGGRGESGSRPGAGVLLARGGAVAGCGRAGERWQGRGRERKNGPLFLRNLNGMVVNFSQLYQLEFGATTLEVSHQFGVSRARSTVLVEQKHGGAM